MKMKCYVNMLRESLARGIESEADFVSTCCTGESLRREILMADSPPEWAVRELEKFDNDIKDAEFLPKYLVADLNQALKELESYGESRLCNRDIDQGEDRLMAIDDILMVGATCARIEHISKDELFRLAKTARETAHKLAPSLSNLWSIAWRMSVNLGPDPDFEGIYDWLGEIASLSRE